VTVCATPTAHSPITNGFGTNDVCDFLLVNISNLGRILHRFRYNYITMCNNCWFHTSNCHLMTSGLLQIYERSLHLHLRKSSSRSAQGFRFRACVTLRTKSVYSASFFPFFRFFFGGEGSCNSLQPRPLDRFWCKICQNTRFRAEMSLFGVAIIKSNI